MFVLREALPGDLRDLRRLAAHLDTVNLPNDERVLRKVLARSRRSFGQKEPPERREYLFVLEDTRRRKVVGTSMIIARHGSKASPHIYFDVLSEERYSETLGRHFKHIVLRLGANYEGPTEVGGLVLLPEYRGDPAQLGKQLSYVRFLFMATHLDCFMPVVLSELLPPLEPDGRSPLWEHLGRKFTGLDYQEADRISQDNKEFIRTLFPSSAVYASLFPKSVQRMIGRVGPSSKGVEKMLKRIGFRYTDRIDPFDGGPHYEAPLRKIRLVRDTRTAALRIGDVPDDGGELGLVAFAPSRGLVRFCAALTRFVRDGRVVVVPAPIAQALGAASGSKVWSLPFPPAREGPARRSSARRSTVRGDNDARGAIA